MSDATTKQQVQDQMKQAMKSGDKQRLGTLRMVLSEIEKVKSQKPDADELDIVRGYQKQLVKAKAEYEQANAVDRVAELDAEIAVTEEFLPAQMSDEQIAEIVDRVLAEHNFGPKDFGRAMKETMSACDGQADGGRVSGILKSKLNS